MIRLSSQSVGRFRVGVTFRSRVLTVGCGIVDVIKSRNEIKLRAAELALEDADVLTGVVALVCRRDSQEVIPFTAHRLGSTIDFKMQQERSNNAPAQDERSAIKIGGPGAKIDNQSRGEPSALV